MNILSIKNDFTGKRIVAVRNKGIYYSMINFLEIILDNVKLVTRKKVVKKNKRTSVGCAVNRASSWPSPPQRHRKKGSTSSNGNIVLATLRPVA